ncbi:ammonium transporter 1 [Striga asiatica]|uniref:Ammonium transporter 1 n=1 Tax=Striga asiatica TaxID=4170 RepID=A0A5A7R698_STRAF|nr:ammonium transporter 1 [Striga asiatica]
MQSKQSKLQRRRVEKLADNAKERVAQLSKEIGGGMGLSARSSLDWLLAWNRRYRVGLEETWRTSFPVTRSRLSYQKANPTEVASLNQGLSRIASLSSPVPEIDIALSKPSCIICNFIPAPSQGSEGEGYWSCSLWFCFCGEKGKTFASLISPYSSSSRYDRTYGYSRSVYFSTIVLLLKLEDFSERVKDKNQYEEG